MICDLGRSPVGPRFWSPLASPVTRCSSSGSFTSTPTARMIDFGPWTCRSPRRENRVHLDLVVDDDLDAATAEVEQLGGRWLGPGTTRELEGFCWRCMADPEGNEFDRDVLPADA